MLRWVSLSIIVAFYSAHLGAMLLDPNLVSNKTSIWHCDLSEYEGEKYHDIIYQNKTIFRLLERATPTWNRLLLQAQNGGGFISLPFIDTDVFIVDTNEFSAFRIVDMTRFNPEHVDLREHRPLARKRYYTAELLSDDCSKLSAYGRPKKITKKLFLALSKAKIKAHKQNAHVVINMDIFAIKKLSTITIEDYIRVMKQDVTN